LCWLVSLLQLRFYPLVLGEGPFRIWVFFPNSKEKIALNPGFLSVCGHSTATHIPMDLPAFFLGIVFTAAGPELPFLNQDFFFTDSPSFVVRFLVTPPRTRLSFFPRVVTCISCRPVCSPSLRDAGFDSPQACFLGFTPPRRLTAHPPSEWVAFFPAFFPLSDFPSVRSFSIDTCFFLTGTWCVDRFRAPGFHDCARDIP